MHGHKTAMSIPLERTHFVILMVGRAAGMTLSFSDWNKTTPFGSPDLRQGFAAGMSGFADNVYACATHFLTWKADVRRNDFERPLSHSPIESNLGSLFVKTLAWTTAAA